MLPLPKAIMFKLAWPLAVQLSPWLWRLVRKARSVEYQGARPTLLARRWVDVVRLGLIRIFCPP